MPDIVTRGTAARELDYQEGDEQISERAREITATPFTLTQVHNREHLICNAGSSVIRLTAPATLSAALDTTFTAGDTIGWRVMISNNSGAQVTLNDNSIQINGGTASLIIEDNSSVIIGFDNESGTQGYFTVSDYDATLGTTLDGKMDLVATVTSPGDAVVIDSNGQAFDAGVPLAIIAYEETAAVSLNAYFGSFTMTHTLGVVPHFVTLKLVCVTPNNGYSTDDEISLPVLSNDSSSDNNTRGSWCWDASTTQVRFFGAQRTATTGDAPFLPIKTPVAVGDSSIFEIQMDGTWSIKAHVLAYTGVVAAP